MKKSLLAAAIVASTLSAPLFAMSNAEVTLNAELAKLASVHFDTAPGVAVDFPESGASPEIVLELGMHVGVRGSQASANPYEITFSEAFSNGSAEPGQFVLYSTVEGGESIPLKVEYSGNGTDHTVVRDQAIDTGLTSDFNIEPTYKPSLDFTKNTLKLTIENQLGYAAGDYTTQIRATVAAI